MDESERYEQICKPKIDEVHADTQAILRILRGVNGGPGLIDDVRDLKRFRKVTIGVVVFVVTTIFIQIAIAIRAAFIG